MSEELKSGEKGKYSEFVVISKLLERGYKVYMPTLDNYGIDCLVDVGEGNYKEIQVKSSRQDNPTFTQRNLKPRDRLYVVCHLRTYRGDDFWIIPSKDFAKIGTQTNGDTQLRIGAEGSDSYHQLITYHENWGTLLAGATEEVKKVVQKTSKRIAAPHLKDSNYKPIILQILARETKPLERQEIMDKLEERIHESFSEADRAKQKGGRTRWEETARWTVTRLKSAGLIKPVKRNQWIITEEGRKVAESFPGEIPDILTLRKVTAKG